jgi:hypothetical protein
MKQLILFENDIYLYFFETIRCSMHEMFATFSSQSQPKYIFNKLQIQKHSDLREYKLKFNNFYGFSMITMKR